jgi:hypothetical protein
MLGSARRTARAKCGPASATEAAAQLVQYANGKALGADLYVAHCIPVQLCSCAFSGAKHQDDEHRAIIKTASAQSWFVHSLVHCYCYDDTVLVCSVCFTAPTEFTQQIPLDDPSLQALSL